ncbi:hypothetical protein AB6813_03285 [bacterium RCC_150]
MTCWVLAQLNLVLKQQFGLVSAAAFPPHATLVGNLHTDVTQDELVKRLSPVFENAPLIEIHNTGLQRVGDCFLFNVHEDGQGHANLPLTEIADAVREAVMPVSVPVNDFLVAPVEEGTFWGHLSVASHDLLINPGLADEVGKFLAELPLTPPAAFRAEVYSLYEFNSNWDSHWWQTLTWRHLKSWEAGRSTG